MDDINDISLKILEKEPSFNIFVRIALYDSLRSLPRIIDLNFNSIPDFISKTSEEVYSLSHKQGGKIPYTIIKEIIENLIHANFKEIIITILNNGNKIMISDQGPGIFDKEKALLPGYTSATSKMKQFIRGVGSGLPIVSETIAFSGGFLDIKDNIKNGTVVTLSINTTNENDYVDLSINKVPIIKNNKKNVESNNEQNIRPSAETELYEKFQKDESDIKKTSNYSKKETPTVKAGEEFLLKKLTMRQIKILFLILELEEAGPSKIANELGYSLSTSFRELAYLEKEGFLKTYSSGKKRLSKKGTKYLEYYSNSF
jgi:DNA-binding MarR family transcriptional regulator